MAKNTNVFSEEVELLNVPQTADQAKPRARKPRSPTIVSVTFDNVGLEVPEDFTKLQMETLSRLLTQHLRSTIVEKANFLIDEIRASSLFGAAR